MPSVTMAIEYLKQLQTNGRGEEKVHVVMVEEEQKKRIANDGPKPATKFVIELDDPDLYSRFHAEKDRILRRAKVKAIGLDIMLKAWQAMDDAWIDKLLAEQEGID